MKSVASFTPAARRSILAWYDTNRRDLPWRKNRDPYRIWISEIMLQQTRVAAVIPRYEEFLRRFPTVQKLAAARESSVLAQWSGLGYYRRARNLHAAAKIIAQEKAFPQTAEAWIALPGIGRYSSAAIASIAFKQPVAVVDGNVARVLRRALGRALSEKKSWDAAQSLLDPARPGDFNQAMMELGATVCLPRQPQCTICPIRKFCRTRSAGRSTTVRLRQQKKEIIYSLSCRDGSILLVRRSQEQSQMPGMWELPKVAMMQPTDGILFSLRHSITVSNFTVRVIAGISRKGQWAKLSSLKRLPLTGLARKILRKARLIQ